MTEWQTTIDTFVQAVERRRPLVVAHARRVSAYAVRLAAQYGLAAQILDDIRVGGLLHDVGKMLIPRHILDKPGRLSGSEWVELRSHPDKGVDLLDRLALSHGVRDIVLHHHERYDGRGYPDRLDGSRIAWPVRIVSVMDAFDALTSAREYRDPLSAEAARALIAREAGTRFCPWVVAGFLSLPLQLLEPGPEQLTIGPYFPDGRPESAAAGITQTWSAIG